MAKRTVIFLFTAIFAFVTLGIGNVSIAQDSNAVPSKKDMADKFQPIGNANQSKKSGVNGKNVNKIDKNAPKYVKDEVLVKFKADKIDIGRYSVPENSINKNATKSTDKQLQIVTDNSGVKSAVRNFASQYKLDQKNSLGKINSAVFKIKDGQDVTKKIAALKKDPNVESAQPNFKYSPTSVDPSDDTSYPNQWGLHNTGQTLTLNEKTGFGAYLTSTSTGTAGADVKAPEAWAVSDGSAHDAIVAVIDTGVAYNSPDLAPNMWDGTNCVDENGDAIPGGCPNHGWDFDTDALANTVGDNDPSPSYYATDWWTGLPVYSYSSHGTHVAGIIAGADNTTGVVGIAPHAKIMAVKTADLTTDEIVKGIAFAQNNGAKVINASWGGYAEDDVLRAAISNFDGLFVAAAGNEYGPAIYPCLDDLSNIICVAATDQNDQLTDWSSYDSVAVDVAAPGDSILSSVGDNDYAYDNFDGLTTPALSAYLTKSVDSNWQSRDVTHVMFNGLGNFGSSWRNVIYGDSFNPYSDNADTTLISDTLDFSDVQNADFYFNTACDTQLDESNWHDYMALETSGDDGATWSEIGRWDESSLHADKSGYSAGTYYNNSLDPSLFTSTFKYRFHWISDGSDNNYGGCLIDSLWNTEYTKGAPGFWDYYSGTSMAAPFVTGLAALLWGTNNTLTNEQVKDVILSTGDSLDSLAGKTVTGKRINAQNAVNKLSDSDNPTVAKLGGGVSDYIINDGGSADLVFSEALSSSSRSVVENALSNELSASGFSGTTSFSWNGDGDTLNIEIAGAAARFNNDVTATVSDIVGNEAADLLLIDSSADETAPTGSVNINNKAASTSSLFATLYPKAIDAVGVYQMRFSDNGSKWSGWITYKTKYTNWNLGTSTYGGNTKKGTKYAYVQFRDRAGNVSTKYRDAITYK